MNFLYQLYFFRAFQVFVCQIIIPNHVIESVSFREYFL